MYQLVILTCILTVQNNIIDEKICIIYKCSFCRNETSILSLKQDGL